MPCRTLHADSIAPIPWKNGGGVTRELLAWPPGAAWQVRLSLADIDRDGPFSPFPGVQRHFAVLRGAGVALNLKGWQRQTAADPPLAFDGAVGPDCRLLNGPTRDLNWMLRGVDGGMAFEPDPRWTWRAVFCPADTRLRWPDGSTHTVAAMSALLDLPTWPQVQGVPEAPPLYLGYR